MKKQHVVMTLLALVFFIVSGCGGGGGGGGRYTLPGEIPTGTGGTGGSGGSGGSGGTGGETNPDSLILSGWEDIKLNSPSSAISKFNQVLQNPNLTDAQKADAYNGLGWATTKTSGLEAAANYFSNAASTNPESKVGMAAVYIQRAQKTGIGQAVSLLEAVGLNDPAYKFVPVHSSIGISNADAHAMLGFAYAWRDDNRGLPGSDSDKAKAQIAVARTEDPSGDSPVGQIYKALQDMGL